jgi:ABC-type sugar transport system ATPase subunit
LCDRVLVMFHGQVIKELETAATNREEVLFYVMGGIDYAKTANNSKGHH